METIAPRSVAFIVCDGVHRDPSGKPYLLGVLRGANSDVFPFTHPPLAVFVALTDGYGPTSITIRLVDARDDEPVYESTMLARFGSPRVVYDTVLPVENVVFRGPGEYYWQMCCGAEVLHEIRFIVLNDGEIG